MASTETNFIKTQYNFTAHIRDPENQPLPDGIEARRMKIYSDLFYNNIEGFVSSAFPVLKSLYSDANWHKMVRDFFVRHRCQSPYFLEISEEFLAYLQNTRQQQAEDPGFLLELAHYEWTELALQVADIEIDFGTINPNGDLLSEHPAISPLAWPLAYQYPVHRISSDFIPDKPEQPSYLIVYRNRNNEVEFIEANAVTARLLQLINENPELTGLQALEQIAAELQTPDIDMIVQTGVNAMQSLQKEGIILGVTSA